MKNTALTPASLLEAVRQSLAQAARYNVGDAVAPAAVLWTDADGQWQPLVAKLKPLMPELVVLGAYQPDQKTGPAIWLRCVIERALPAVALPDAVTPVIYLPNVSRQTLRAAEDCPDDLKPLIELQYRGVVWTQINGKDWTVDAFLMSEDGGLGFDVARDQRTHQALLGALPVLANTPVAALRGRRLEAEDFDKLMIGDPQRDLLHWLGDPSGTRAGWDSPTWTAFCSRCQADYGFDPERDGEIVGGEKLGLRQGAWALVWQRFADSPSLYPGVPNLLRRAKPATLIFDGAPWPDENAAAEDALRTELLTLGKKLAAEVRARVAKLEIDHAPRRSWVWAKLGASPLAEAIGQLAVVAKYTEHVLGGAKPEDMAAQYADGAFRADDAALKAVAAVKTPEDLKAVTAVLHSLYLPWLDDSARNLQALIKDQPLPDAEGLRETPAVYLHHQCLLFCDGLRFDLSQRLAAKAEERGLHVEISRSWAALPTVTGTAKPAVAPIAGELAGGTMPADFQPALHSDEPLNADRFRRLLANAGYQVLAQADTGNPVGDTARAWTEFGEIDKLGHTLEAKLAAQIDEHLDGLVARVAQLLAAGWQSVRLMTDHGWLLLPDGLPEVGLPKYLTESRWSRCAAIKAGGVVSVPTTRWHWNPREAFAHAPGVHCFGKGHEYAHGGVSIQECLIPVLSFSLDQPAALVTAAVKDIQWLGLRCRVAIEPPAPGLRADLRTKPNDPAASVAAPKEFDAEGRAALLVANEELLGTMASLVILDSSGRVLAKQATTVGGDK